MKIRVMTSALALAMAAVTEPAGAQDGNATASATPPPELIAFERGLHKQTGDVAIPGAKAVLHLGQHYYFIGPAEAAQVITKVWGNPPSEGQGVLGMIFPAGSTTYDNVWGAIVTYQDSGYVSDSDANSQDYDKVLTDLRAGEAEDNAARKKDGYPELHLVGWAQPPSYDKASHSLIWARDLKSSTSSVDGLNYDVRSLGRHGVLSLNMVTSMPHLAEMHEAAADLGKAAVFEKGSAYADYDKSVDKTAEYGLAGLVAAGAGIVVAKKLGLLAIMFGFGKWILIGFAAVAATMRRWIGKLFNRQRDTLEG